MRYAIDVVQPDGRCRTLVVEPVGGVDGGLVVLRNGQSTTIEWNDKHWNLRTVGGTRLNTRSVPRRVYSAPVEEADEKE